MLKFIERKRGLRPRVVRVFEGESLTKQSQADDADINYILRKYPVRAAESHYRMFSGEYGFAPAADFHEAMEIVRQGEAMFSELPAKIRDRFGNDPGAFLAFVQDESNAEEMAALGLREAPELDEERSGVVEGPERTSESSSASETSGDSDSISSEAPAPG